MTFYLSQSSRPGRLASRSGFISRATGLDAESGERVLQTLEVGGTAGALAFLQGMRNADPQIAATQKMPSAAGIPLDLGIAVVGVLAVLSGSVPNKAKEHVHAVANGALASFAVSLGQSYGEKTGAKSASSNTPTTTTSGYTPYQRAYARALREGNPHLSEAQIAAVTARQTAR